MDCGDFDWDGLVIDLELMTFEGGVGGFETDDEHVVVDDAEPVDAGLLNHLNFWQ